MNQINKDDLNTTNTDTNENISSSMESIFEEEASAESCSSLKQFIYLFTSWDNFFKNVKIKGKPLFFLLPLLLIILAISFSIKGFTTLTLENVRVQLEEIYSNDQFNNLDTDALIDEAIELQKNLYKPIPFTISQSILIVLGVLINSAMVFILSMIFGNKNKSFVGILTISLGATIFSQLYQLYYYNMINITGSFTDVTSLGIFVPNNDLTSPIYLLASSISLLSLIQFFYYYFAGIKYCNFSNIKSLLFTFIIYVIPVTFSIGTVVLTSMFYTV